MRKNYPALPRSCSAEVQNAWSTAVSLNRRITGPTKVIVELFKKVEGKQVMGLAIKIPLGLSVSHVTVAWDPGPA